MRRVLAVAGILVALAAVAGAAEKTPRTLTVTGTAEVNVPPDICYMSFGAETYNKSSATQAYEDNTQVMNAVTEAVKTAGIPAKDIQTTNLSIAPQYHYEEKSNKRRFDGYRVSQNISVKVRDLSKVSIVIDAAVGAGATEVGSVRFTVENPKRYTQDARIEALEAARAKAEKIAATCGVKLGRPISISENEPGSYNWHYAQANVEMDRTVAGGDIAGAHLQPGEMKLTHTVHITYEIE